MLHIASFCIQSPRVISACLDEYSILIASVELLSSCERPLPVLPLRVFPFSETAIRNNTI